MRSVTVSLNSSVSSLPSKDAFTSTSYDFKSASAGTVPSMAFVSGLYFRKSGRPVTETSEPSVDLTGIDTFSPRWTLVSGTASTFTSVAGTSGLSTVTVTSTVSLEPSG